MAMFNSGMLQTGEVLDLSDVIALVSPTDTPIMSILMAQGRVVPAEAVTVSWREEALDTNRLNPSLEGAEAGEAVTTKRATKTNNCQILSKVTAITGTVRALNPKGIGSELNRQVLLRLTEVKRDGEYYLLQGAKADEHSSTPRQMDGLLNLVGNTVAAPSGKLKEETVIEAFKKMWDKGASGGANVICAVNATVKGYLNSIFKETSTLVANQGTNNVLGVTISKLVTDFGEAEIILDRHMPTDQLLLVDLDQVELAELRAAQVEGLGKSGDNEKVQVVHEFTVKLLNQFAGAKITGITGYQVGEPSLPA